MEPRPAFSPSQRSFNVVRHFMKLDLEAAVMIIGLASSSSSSDKCDKQTYSGLVGE